MPLAWFDVGVHQGRERRHGPQVDHLAERATLLQQEIQADEGGAAARGPLGAGRRASGLAGPTRPGEEV